MFGLRQYPFVRILIPFATGILLALIRQVEFPTIVLTVVVALTLFMHLLSRVRKLRLYRYMYLWGVATQLALVLLGNKLGYHAVDTHHANHFLNLIKPSSALVISIKQPLLDQINTGTVMIGR